MKIEGGCHCGHIKYEAEVDPAGAGICHCTDCQVFSGSAFRVVVSTPAESAPFRCYVGHASRPVALKMVPGGRVMLSGGWRGRWNPETGRGETTEANIAGNWAEAVALFPRSEEHTSELQSH